MTKPQSNLSQLRDFLAYLATVKGDLSNITAPPFLLSPRSVTEIPASWAEHQPLFLAPASEPDPARRALLVLQNFLCSLKAQAYTGASSSSSSSSSDDGGGGVKKPLNPFLGELFLGTFDDDDDDDGDSTSSPSPSSSKSSSSTTKKKKTKTTRLISEQVSHHPPVTACVIYNQARGISAAGYVAQETSYSVSRASVAVRQVGHVLLRDEAHGESHLMTLPTLAVRGLVLGDPHPELTGTCYIVSSAGFLSTVAFDEGGGGGGGKTIMTSLVGGGHHGTAEAAAATGRNSVRATLCNLRENEKPLFEVVGQWDGAMKIKDLQQQNGEDNAVVVDEFHVDAVPRREVQTKPLAEQSPWESRRAWSRVAEGIRAGDLQQVSAAKADIEEGQRAIRRAEQQLHAAHRDRSSDRSSSNDGGGGDGDVEVWPRMFFRNTDHDDEYEVLARAIPDPEQRPLQLGRTAGVWKFIGVPAAEGLLARGGFHRGLAPAGQLMDDQKSS